jgi:hypothetical protein
VMVLDSNGHATKSGSEVRIFELNTRKCLGSRIMDTGSGYCSQNVMSVHFGLPEGGPVDIEVTSRTRSGRKVTRIAGVLPAQSPLQVMVP